MKDLFIDKSILSIKPENEHSNWRINFDGVLNIHGNGTVAILISSTCALHPIGINLRFSCIYMTKHEACITSLEVALDMNAKDLVVYGDYILIISQFIREWDRNQELAKYKGSLRGFLLSIFQLSVAFKKCLLMLWQHCLLWLRYPKKLIYALSRSTVMVGHILPQCWIRAGW